MLGFTDEEMDLLSALALPMPPPLRDGFLRLVASKAAAYPQLHGPSIVDRVAMEVQRDFLKNGPVAVGPGGRDREREKWSPSLLSAYSTIGTSTVQQRF